MTDLHVIASVSGGKDSTAMCLHLQEQGISYTPVFIDTGWESRKTYQYIEEILPGIVGDIVTIKAEVQLPEDLEEVARLFEQRLGRYSAMVRTILLKNSFPKRFQRFCTQSLKVFPMRDYLRGLDREPVNAIGIRSDESRARSQAVEREYSKTYDCDVWRPILSWSVDDVIAIHHRHNVKPCPLYLDGMTRVGCWPCVFARKSEIRHIAENDPDRIDLLEDLERVLTGRANVKKDALKRERLSNPLAWFSTKHTGKSLPIRDAIEWSRTKHGGRQFEMFAPSSRDSGCMRWGLCDTGAQP